jgi:hypothetical protein
MSSPKRARRVGRFFAQQYGFVLGQVLGHPVSEIGQDGYETDAPFVRTAMVFVFAARR